ncbi:MAG: DNA polymerase III subunit delta [Bacillota bacterium]
MAYRDEKHAYEQLTEDMKTGDIPAVVVLRGKEEYLVDFYAKRLIDRFVTKESSVLDLTTMERDKVTVDGIIGSLETMPFMSERKVVFLPEFFDGRGRMPKVFEKNQNDRKALVEQLSAIDPERALLLITAANPEDYRAEQTLKESEIYKAVSRQGRKGVGRVYDFGPLNRRQLSGFIEKRLRSTGKQYRQGLISSIIRDTDYENRDTSYGLYELNNDLKKIVAYCGDAPEITQQDVAEVVGTNPEKNVFRMVEALAANRKDDALRLLHYLLQDGGAEMAILSTITEQLEIMLTVCEMKDDGVSPAEIQKTLAGGYMKNKRIAEYRSRKALESGNRMGTANIRRALAGAYKVEKDVKNGLMPGRLALEYYIGSL